MTLPDPQLPLNPGHVFDDAPPEEPPPPARPESDEPEREATAR